jgi:hypothetical protein
MTQGERTVRIGGAAGFWGDSSLGAVQLVRSGRVDFLMFDYLAELTMSLLVRARQKDPGQGYATDFPAVVKLLLPQLRDGRLRLVANAGGINPAACAAAIRAVGQAAGVPLRVAVVEGDDVLGLLDALRAEGVREMSTGAPLPEGLLSANAYLGAGPVAAALDRGAQIVVTGRVADSALALGILMHEFGWAPDDWDRLAAGSLCGHLLECGAQATGGLHTDWESVPDWANIGYPIAECRADGSFTVTKPPGTGGLVTPAVLAEQMLYEVGDPASYVLPDVIADFTAVRMVPEGPDRVRVDGARGRPATGSYKVSATHADGWRSFATLSVIGIDAARKARRTAEAIRDRVAAILRARGLPPLRAHDIEVLGAESVYGPHARTPQVREVVMKLGVEHDDPAALAIFAREIAAAGTSFAPGTTGFAGGRPKPQPIVRLFSFLLAKDLLPAPTVALDGSASEPVAVRIPDPPGRAEPQPQPAPDPAPPGPVREVPLVALAWGRSGDKGDSANVAILARRPDLVPILRRELSAERVRAYFAHLVTGSVTRFEVPGVDGFNFLMTGALGGGGMASLRNDPLGKGLAQMLLDLPVAVPADLALPDRPAAAAQAKGSATRGQ